MGYFAAIAAIMGTIIGAGILGIPYVIVKSGFGIGSILLIIVFLMMLIIMLYFGEIVLRTRDRHHLSGYAEKYLGKNGKRAMMISIFLGIYSALLAYLIGEGESLSFFIFGSVNYALELGLLFWFLLAFVSYFGIKSLKKGESIGVLFVLALVVSILLLYIGKIDYSNLSYNNFDNFYAPFGVILFAFLGFSIIPEIKDILSGERGKMKGVIFAAMTAVLIIYFLFSFVVVGVKGQDTPQLATLALGRPFVLLGILTMFTAYLSLSNVLIDSFMIDFGHSRIDSWIYTAFLPGLLYAVFKSFGIGSFVKILGVGGVLSGGLAGILILMMHKRAKEFGDRDPEYSVPYYWFAALFIGLLFVVGAGFEIWNLLF